MREITRLDPLAMIGVAVAFVITFWIVQVRVLTYLVLATDLIPEGLVHRYHITSEEHPWSMDQPFHQSPAQEGRDWWSPHLLH